MLVMLVGVPRNAKQVPTDAHDARWSCRASRSSWQLMLMMLVGVAWEYQLMLMMRVGVCRPSAADNPKLPRS